MTLLIPFEQLLESRISTKITLFFLALSLSLPLAAQNNATNGGMISTDQSVCIGTAPATLTSNSPATGGDTNLDIEYLWMVSSQYTTAGSSTWSPAPGVNNQETYDPPAPYGPTYYTRCARRAGFPTFPAESNIVTITLLNSPTATIQNNPSTTFVGTTVDLSATTSFSSTYTWDFDGDGTTDCTGRNCSYTYNVPGTYTIFLTVNNGSCEITTSQTITVQSPTLSRINDPCSCDNPANFQTSTMYFVKDYILINSGAGETWTVSSINQGAIYDGSGNIIPAGTAIPETATAGRYYLNIWFESGVGFDLSVSNGTTTLNTGTTAPCSCINPLPVELTSFQGKVQDETVVLTWTTATEINNSHFEVQRSLDGSRFDFVGAQEGLGTTNQPQHYTLVDKERVVGETYYRLKQVDFDGAYEFSNIIAIKVPTKNVIAAVIPNPIEDKTMVKFGLELSDYTKLEVRTVTGQLVKTYQVTGKNQEVNFQDLQRGIYFLNIKNAAQSDKAFYKIVKL